MSLPPMKDLMDAYPAAFKKQNLASGTEAMTSGNKSVQTPSAPKATSTMTRTLTILFVSIVAVFLAVHLWFDVTRDATEGDVLCPIRSLRVDVATIISTVLIM